MTIRQGGVRKGVYQFLISKSYDLSLTYQHLSYDILRHQFRATFELFITHNCVLQANKHRYTGAQTTMSGITNLSRSEMVENLLQALEDALIIRPGPHPDIAVYGFHQRIEAIKHARAYWYQNPVESDMELDIIFKKYRIPTWSNPAKWPEAVKAFEKLVCHRHKEHLCKTNREFLGEIQERLEKPGAWGPPPGKMAAR
jgi:hypothetical protein